MPKIVIDGVEVEAREGQTVLQAALDAGIHIPHFCFHPNLKVAGNCRMCLVELEKVPKLQIACGTPVREGMVVTTKNDRVKKAREAVLEFLLINHPLDCPICDQCGECKLQDYCFEYGKNKSRFSENKHTFPKLNIGSDLERNQNRCIHCTRCIRVLRDVGGSEELGLSERSGHTVVGPYMDKDVESEFSLNAADVCPVGALTSKHFRFKARSWLMNKTRTICTGCSRGCNAVAWVYKDELLRMTPAENDDVNRTWLCNMGRLSISEVTADTRLLKAEEKGKAVASEDAVASIASGLQKLMDGDKGDKIAILVSTRLSNEDAYAVKRLADGLGTKMLATVGGSDDDKPFGPVDKPLTEWFIRQDGTPNAKGVQDVLGETMNATAVIGAIEAGDVKGLLVFGADPVTRVEGGEDALLKLDLLVAVDVHQSKTTKMANIVLPEASAFERDATYTNEGGRLQRAEAALASAGDSHSAWQWVAYLMKQMNISVSFESAEDLFNMISLNVADYKGLSLYEIPEVGVQVGVEETKQDDETESEPQEKAD